MKRLLWLFLTLPMFAQTAVLGSFTVAQLPAASSANTNSIAYVTDAASDSTCASGSGSQKVRCISNGSSWVVAQSDLPQVVYIPSANNVNGTGGIGWTCNSATPAVLLRAGTNNKDALLSPWGASDVCYFRIHLPKDWDTAVNPSIMLELTSTSTTNSQTIIMQESVACAKLDGSTTDDVAFNAARSLSTVTLNGNANRTWEADLLLNSTDMTGCAAPSIMWIKISRTTDTATNVGVYGATVTIPILPKVQAN